MPTASNCVSLIEVVLIASWRIAVRHPSAVAPRVIVCRHSGCGPTWAYCCARVSCSLTGRPTTLAAAAARISCGQTYPLLPKPPPVCGEIERTFSGGIPNAALWTGGALKLAWAAFHKVSRSPSHAATVADVSIGLWWRDGWK